MTEYLLASVRELLVRRIRYREQVSQCWRANTQFEELLIVSWFTVQSLSSDAYGDTVGQVVESEAKDDLKSRCRS